MYIKFLKHGKGDPAKAASYLIDEVDHLNRPRPDVQVLRGDPQTFTAIAESIQNEWKYTSGVIAWSKDDAPTNDEIDQVLEAFEKHAFAGLKPNQYHFTAVLHEEDDGSKHVHFLVPRVELDTGKALNIAPPGNQKYFDPLRDYFNYSKVWSRPDDPALQRDTQKPDYMHFEDVAALRAGLKDEPVNNVREKIGSYIEQRVDHGFIKNRKDVLDAVSELGEVTRISDKFISLKLDGADKAIRLKGAFYESEFSIESYIKDRARTPNDARASRENRGISAEHRKLAEQCRTKFTALAGKRSTYNRKRYYSTITSAAELNFSQIREQQFSRLDRETDNRNNYAFKATNTAVTADQSAVSAVERYEQSDSRNSKAQKDTFDINHSHVFNFSNLADLNTNDELCDQNQIYSNSSSSRRTINRASETSRSQTGFGFEQKRTAKEVSANSLQGLDNDNRNTVIEDHRAATAAAQRAAADTRASITAHTEAGADYQRARELHENFKRETHRSGQDSTDVSADRAKSFRTNYLSAFFTDYSRQLESTVTDTFKRFSAEFTDRYASECTDSEYSTKSGATRNIDTDRATGGENNRENALSRAISTKISSIDSTNINAALEKIERTQEMRRERERKNNRGYDSPSPF